VDRPRLSNKSAAMRKQKIVRRLPGGYHVKRLAMLLLALGVCATAHSKI